MLSSTDMLKHDGINSIEIKPLILVTLSYLQKTPKWKTLHTVEFEIKINVTQNVNQE